MKYKKIVIGFIILFGLINIKTQCGRQMPQRPDYKYSFSEKMTASPYQLNYNEGDTIMLQLNVPGKKLFDTKTNARIFFDSASLPITVAVNLVFNNPYIGDGPFASFIYSQGISAYTQSYSGTTYASITTGCTASNDYTVTVGVVLIKKGVFALSVSGNDLTHCFNGYSAYAQFMLLLDVDHTHKSYYQQLPFSDIGKIQDNNIITGLDRKNAAIINVQ